MPLRAMVVSVVGHKLFYVIKTYGNSNNSADWTEIFRRLRHWKLPPTDTDRSRG